MKAGQLVAVIAAILGIGVVMTAFLINASPYVTIAEARKSEADNLHVPGDILKETLNVSTSKGQVTFMIRDKEGDTIPILYKGAPPANMGEATKVVVVGGVKNNIFEARKMILKCPSKYESEASSGAKTAFR